MEIKENIMAKKILVASLFLSLNTLLLFIAIAGVSGQDYEFLVRVKDKGGDNVTCFNPAHDATAGYDFTDDTHAAVCPECNANQYLYRDNDVVTKKGDIITFKRAGWNWGTNERKHYAIIRINDITYEQAQKWSESGTIRARKYKVDIDGAFSQGQRADWIDPSKDPGIIVATVNIKGKINEKRAMDTSFLPVDF